MTEDLDADMLDVGYYNTSQVSLTFTPTKANRVVLSFIEATFQSIISALEGYFPPDEICVTLKRPASTGGKSISRRNEKQRGNDDQSLENHTINSREARFCWPGSTAEEAWRFACILAILADIRTAIINGTVITKRDIYYRQPELFKRQETVDRWIDDIAFSCGVARKDLMVCASPKGLMCGFSLNDRIQSIPQDFDFVNCEDIKKLRWILVVEKEASFKTLVEKSFEQSSAMGQGLLITAKGYPDLQTRAFLRHILDVAVLELPVPVFGLFDCDPDGLDIYRCYHSGSKKAVQETAYNIPEIRWLGVDMLDFLGNPSVLGDCLTMTGRDRIRARAMLKRIRPQDVSGQGAEMRRLLQTMLMLGSKMEIQAADRIEGGLCNWLEMKMAGRC